MWNSRVDVSDVLAAARKLHGLERLDQVKCAVLERNGDISIIPERGGELRPLGPAMDPSGASPRT